MSTIASVTILVINAVGNPPNAPAVLTAAPAPSEVTAAAAADPDPAAAATAVHGQVLL